jgi:hypothetical protein
VPVISQQRRGSKQQDLLVASVLQEAIAAISLREAQKIKVITVIEVIEQITHHVIKKPKPVPLVKKAKLCLPP